MLKYYLVLLGLSLTLNSSGQNPNLKPQETIGPANGTLIISGGGYSPKESWIKEFVKHIGGYNEPIVLIPTGTTIDSLSQEFLDNFKLPFVGRGFTNVTVLHTRDTAVANSDDFISPIKKAKGVFFSGGRHWLYADAYLNTKTHKALRDLLERGGVIAGISAGATIQGSYMIRGDTKGPTIIIGDHVEGLSFMSNTVIDQHHLARNRQFDMFQVLEKHPELLGIGIDERTGITVQGNIFTVFGESYVAVYDGTRWSKEQDTIYQLPVGSREFYFLKAGQQYDLKKRKVVTFDDRVFIDLTRDQINKYMGQYQLKRGELTLEIFFENESIMARQSWNKAEYSIHPESEFKFYINESDEFLLFETDSLGEINGFYLPLFENNEYWLRIVE